MNNVLAVFVRTVLCGCMFPASSVPGTSGMPGHSLALFDQLTNHKTLLQSSRVPVHPHQHGVFLKNASYSLSLGVKGISWLGFASPND